MTQVPIEKQRNKEKETENVTLDINGFFGHSVVPHEARMNPGF